jgi:hypothetical protein
MTFATKNLKARCDVAQHPCGGTSKAATVAVTHVEFRYKWKQNIIFFQISSETTRVLTATVAAFDVPPQWLSLAGNLEK